MPFCTRMLYSTNPYDPDFDPYDLDPYDPNLR